MTEVFDVSTFSLRFEDISWARKEWFPPFLPSSTDDCKRHQTESLALSKRRLVCRSVEKKRKVIATVSKSFVESPNAYTQLGRNSSTAVCLCDYDSRTPPLTRVELGKVVTSWSASTRSMPTRPRRCSNGSVWCSSTQTAGDRW